MRSVRKRVRPDLYSSKNELEFGETAEWRVEFLVEGEVDFPIMNARYIVGDDLWKHLCMRTVPIKPLAMQAMKKIDRGGQASLQLAFGVRVPVEAAILEVFDSVENDLESTHFF